MTASCLRNISLSAEIDEFVGSFRAACANSSCNVNRSWNFRSSLNRLCLCAPQ
jgi:hypothetical protein